MEIVSFRKHVVFQAILILRRYKRFLNVALLRPTAKAYLNYITQSIVCRNDRSSCRKSNIKRIRKITC